MITIEYVTNENRTFWFTLDAHLGEDEFAKLFSGISVALLQMIILIIEECFDVFHMEGDRAVFEEIQMVLRCKGVNIHAEID